MVVGTLCLGYWWSHDGLYESYLWFFVIHRSGSEVGLDCAICECGGVYTVFMGLS